MKRIATLLAIVTLALGLIVLAYAMYLGAMPGIMEQVRLGL